MLTAVAPVRSARLHSGNLPHRHTWRCSCSAEDTASDSKPQQPCKFIIQRRNLLLAAAVAATAKLAGPPPSRAFDFLPPSTLPGGLPSGYVDLVRKLVQALKESIIIDKDGATELEVRRKADPAKDLVKQWVSKWSRDNVVRGNESHLQITAALQELGSFYTKNGQRSRLTKTVADSILAKLQAAEDALPAGTG